MRMRCVQDSRYRYLTRAGASLDSVSVTGVERKDNVEQFAKSGGIENAPLSALEKVS